MKEPENHLAWTVRRYANLPCHYYRKNRLPLRLRVQSACWRTLFAAAGNIRPKPR